MTLPTDITGTTQLYAIVGDPIAQVRAPLLFNDYFARQGIDAVFTAFHIKEDDVSKAMDGFKCLRNLDGLVVTVPHKFAFAELIDDLGEHARLVGAVNAIRRTADGQWIGELYDGIGFVEGLIAEGYDPAGKSFLIVGAGGAGSAIAGALLKHPVSRMTIVDAVSGKAGALCRKLETAAPSLPLNAGDPDPDPSGFDFVVNATPLGMSDDDPLPVDVGRLSPNSVVAEAIMKPPVTRLLREARDVGCRIQPGGHMIDHQFPLFLRFFEIADRSTRD